MGRMDLRVRVVGRARVGRGGMEGMRPVGRCHSALSRHHGRLNKVAVMEAVKSDSILDIF